MQWVYMKGISIDAQYLYRRAMDLVRQERYETAIRYFRQATVLAPGYAKAFSAMASCHVHLGKFDDAIGLYNRAIAIDPACEDVQILRGIIVQIQEILRNCPYQATGLSSRTGTGISG